MSFSRKLLEQSERASTYCAGDSSWCGLLFFGHLVIHLIGNGQNTQENDK